ncbi:MAG: 2,3-diphosphoglycerate-dependent phosphoglycerate mutase [Pseudomonadota bacterium]
MAKLALLRHGQSEWNLQNRFTGWVDVDLTERGVAEAQRAGAMLAAEGGDYVACYASVLKRAIRTLNFALEGMDRLWLPVTKDWRLNERHYGGLTGLNKAETAERHGADQVKVWRRSYDTPPPPFNLSSNDQDVADPRDDPRYAHVAPDVLPNTESLKTTLDRVEPYWRAEIAPRLEDGESLIVAAHGNSLRAIVKLLFDVSDDDIVSVEIPTGNPLVIGFADRATRPISARYLDEARASTLPRPPSQA